MQGSSNITYSCRTLSFPEPLIDLGRTVVSAEVVPLRSESDICLKIFKVSGVTVGPAVGELLATNQL